MRENTVEPQTTMVQHQSKPNKTDKRHAFYIQAKDESQTSNGHKDKQQQNHKQDMERNPRQITY